MDPKDSISKMVQLSESKEAIQGAPEIPKPIPVERPWKKILKSAHWKAMSIWLIFFTVLAGLVLLARLQYKSPDKSGDISLQKLADLPSSSVNLGQPGETLTVGANANFKGKLQVAGDVDVAGKINSANPLTVAGIEVAGNSRLSAAELSSNLRVSGTSILQGNVTVERLLSVGGNLNVTGDGSFGGTVNGGQLNVRSAAINGPLTVGGHLITTGNIPTLSTGTAIGSGGNGSISGNDSSGTVNFNTGGAPPAGILGTISFRQTYSVAPKVQLTPTNSSAAGLQYYVTKTTTGFSVSVAAPPAAGSNYTFDYFVTQ